MVDSSTTSRRRPLTTLAVSSARSAAGCETGSPTPVPVGPASPSATDGPAAPSATTDEFPTWTTGEKLGVGTVADHGTEDPSRVWFTLTRGALTEPRFPRVDLMNLRSVDFLVTDGEGYAVRTLDVEPTDEDTVERTVEPVEGDALVYRHRFAGTDRDWELTVEYAADPGGDALLADVEFAANDGPYDVYALAESAVAGGTAGDEGERLADGDGHAIGLVETAGDGVVRSADGAGYGVATAVATDGGFGWATVDVPTGDSVGPLLERGERTVASGTASGAVVAAGQLADATDEAGATLSLGFALEQDLDAALGEARAALEAGYDAVRAGYVDSWRSCLADVAVPDSVAGDAALADQYRAALMVIKAVEDKTFPGAGIASPSVPWGSGVGCEEPTDYGYNYVWGRDLYQVFTAFEAAGDVESARLATEYVLTVQQDETGFLPQNTFLDGCTRWGGEQLDEIAFPAVMAYQLRERHGLDFDEVEYDYEHVRRAASYVVEHGPESHQERWEEEYGWSPSTIAAEIAGLACAAKLAQAEGHREEALLYLGVADHWQRNVEEWCATTTGTDDHEETPYYFRVNDDADPDDGADRDLANGGPTTDERAVVDAGFLELVRLGLKPHDDEVVRNSVEVVDDTIRVETPNGPAWYRYNGDGYGEGEDGASFGAPWPTAAQGRGRLWPIFTGERAEYELLAGTERGDLAPRALLETMQRFANEGRMIPEQVWDREDPSPYDREFGEGTAAATPLAWSMAQYVRLAHALDAGEPVETPAFTRERYVDGGAPSPPALSVELPSEAVDEPTVTVGGQTEGDVVLIDCGGTTRNVSVEDGAFDTSVELVEGRQRLTVVSAGSGPLVDAGVALERSTVSYVQ